MADLQQNISNTVGMIAGGPSAKWGAVTWNAFVWGEDSDLITNVTKLIVNAQASDTALSKTPTKVVTGQAITMQSDPSSEMIGDGSGYSYVFVSNTTDGEERDFAEWTEDTESTTWSEASYSTSWTEG